MPISLSAVTKPTRIAAAVAMAMICLSAHADATVDSIEATASYKLGTDPTVNLSASGSPSVDVVAFPYSAPSSAVVHSYGSDTGNFGSRSSGLGVYDTQGMFRISQTITNTTAFAQNATFNFYITPGFINNQIGTALTGSNYLSAGISFGIQRNGGSIWGSSAVLSSNSAGTTYTTTGDAGLYSGSGTYYSINGVNRSIDLGVLNAGQSMTLSYEMSSFAKGVSEVGDGRWVPETRYVVPGQWVDPCWGECGYGYGGDPEFIPEHEVVVPAYYIPSGLMSGSHASSGDPFDINWQGNPYFTGQPGMPPAGSSVTFTSAVPEPAEFAMLLTGLGLVGWTARRRKAKALA